MTGADNLLSRLDRVRRIAPGRWSACCPAHDSKSGDSLRIREADDGRILLYDFGGCSLEAVLGAMGLDMTALFPPRLAEPGAGHKPERRPFLPADVFDIARSQIGVVALISCDMHADKSVSDVDHHRLLQAVQTLDRIVEVAYGS